MLGACDAVHADIGNLSASVRRDVVDQFARTNLEWLSAESTRMRRRNSDRVAGNSTVTCDDTIKLELERGIANSKEIVAFQIRRDFKQNRDAMRRLAGALAYRVEDLAHLLRRLPVAQPGRVRRAHVNYDEVRKRAHPCYQSRVVGGDTGQLRVLVGPEVEAEANRDTGFANPLDSARDRVHSFARETETVDERLALADAPDSWAFVSRLRPRRNRSQFRKAEAERLPSAHRDRVLVHSRREADGI